ncbi:MAG: hypothetical protein GQ533_12565 [Methanosarcinaceae archaeon]|nr:hypothetical protein [Methanosarcinaceae archaeon]
MKTRNGMRIISVLMTLLLVSAMAMPAMACMPSAQSMDGTDIVDNFTIENEHDFEKLKALLRVVTDKNAISVIKDLQRKGYNLQYGKTNVQRIYPKGNESQEALLVIIPAESKNSYNSAQVVFASNGEMTCVANAIIEDGEDYRRIEVYEIDNGIEKNYVVENKAGTISVDGNTIITELQTSSDDDCDTCITVCEYIYAGGCVLTGYFTCLSACSFVTGPGAAACPLICGVIWAVICLYGSNNSCPTLCESYC